MNALTSKIESALKNLAYNTFLFVVEHIDRVVHAKRTITSDTLFNSGLTCWLPIQRMILNCPHFI